MTIESVFIWLYIFINPWGNLDISAPLRVEMCTEKVRDGAEWGRGDRAQCVHAIETWRRITADGPNENEIEARKKARDPSWLMYQQRKEDEAKIKAGKALAAERVDQLEWEKQMMGVTIMDQDEKINRLCAELNKKEPGFCAPPNTDGS